MRLQDLKKNKKVRFAYTLISVIVAAYMQAFIIHVFIEPSNLLSSGFTGVALLISRITELFGSPFRSRLG